MRQTLARVIFVCDCGRKYNFSGCHSAWSFTCEECGREYSAQIDVTIEYNRNGQMGTAGVSEPVMSRFEYKEQGSNG